MKKLLLILLIQFCVIHVFAQSGELSNKPITIELVNISVADGIKQICKKYNIDYVLNPGIDGLSKKISKKYQDVLLKTVLNELLKETKIEYNFVGNQIIFKQKQMKNKSYLINGYIEDSESKERLIGCNIIDSVSKQGVITNPFGYFNIMLSEGYHNLTYSYLGYKSQSIIIDVKNDTFLIVKITPITFAINEVQVKSGMGNDAETKLSRPQMGLMKLKSNDINQMPAMLGERDVIRTIQSLPGIQAVNERSTGMSVRGGGIDQNLFLLDDAPIFNTSHITGLFSVFNSDAVKEIKIFKGDIPANYGGRISSLTDVRLKDGNMKKFAVSGGLGNVTANLNIEGPIIKNRVSFLISAKHSLALYFLNAKFYDLNVKLNAIINDKNRIYISTYRGYDETKRIGNYSYANNTFSLRWNHIYNPKLFSNISLIYSKYNVVSGNADDVNNNINYTWNSGIEQYTLKADYTYYLNNSNTIDFGISSSLYKFYPGTLKGNKQYIEYITEKVSFSNRIVDQEKVLDHAFFVSNQHEITDKISFRYGVRLGVFQNLGGNMIYKIDNYQVVDSFQTSNNEIYKQHYHIEPRLGLNYRITENSTVKASYTYTTQQLQLLNKTNGGGPFDIWYPSGYNIKPQKSSQYCLGYVHYFFNKALETSIEGYYKNMHNIIDYKDGATLFDKSAFNAIDKTNYNFEEQLRIGRGWAYGAEFMIRGEFKKINGYANYTLARSKRIIPDINFGKTYLSPFDRPHSLNLFINYQLNSRLSFSANWKYSSGAPITVPIYTMEMYGKLIKGYSERNGYRLPDYHRLDLGLSLKNKQKPGRKYNAEWDFSVINAYNHSNISYINFVVSEENPDKTELKGVYMFGIIPSISYHFNF